MRKFINKIFPIVRKLPGEAKYAVPDAGSLLELLRKQGKPGNSTSVRAASVHARKKQPFGFGKRKQICEHGQILFPDICPYQVQRFLPGVGDIRHRNHV